MTDTTLKWTHFGAMLLHLAQGVGGEAVVNTVFQDKGFFPTTNSVAYPPDQLVTNQLGDLQVTQLVPVFSLLSSVNHAWAFFDQARYTNYVQKGYNPVRWAEYSISAGLMNVVLAALCGWTDVKAYTFLAVANMAMQMTGFSIEQDTAEYLRTRNPAMRRSAIKQQVTGFLVFAAILIPIWVAFFTSLSDSSDDVPTFVWAIIFILSAFYLSFGLVSLAYTLQWRKPSFRTIELAYLVLSFTSKTFLANMTLFGAANR